MERGHSPPRIVVGCPVICRVGIYRAFPLSSPKSDRTKQNNHSPFGLEASESLRSYSGVFRTARNVPVVYCLSRVDGPIINVITCPLFIQAAVRASDGIWLSRPAFYCGGLAAEFINLAFHCHCRQVSSIVSSQVLSSILPLNPRTFAV